MVIRIALARKLLVRLNAKALDARAAYANLTTQIVTHPEKRRDATILCRKSFRWGRLSRSCSRSLSLML